MHSFLDIFGKFAAVIGPALYAVVYSLSGKACYGILSVILLFILGLVFLTVGKPYFAAADNKR